jgi:hypothetical protein
LKKKPLVTVKNAHAGKPDGCDANNGLLSDNDNWVTSVAAVHNTDLVATGKSSYIICHAAWQHLSRNIQFYCCAV